MHARLTGVGSALPAQVIGNEHFNELGLTDRWIASRTGISERRRLGPDEELSDLAASAARRALRDAGRTSADVDFIVAATLTPDRASPALATEVASRIGAASPAAVDVNGACTGFLFALDYAVARVGAGTAECVLVCGADATSRIIDPTDPITGPLFGDGAGAVVVERAEGPCACDITVRLASDGRRSQILTVEREGRRLRMSGIEVYQMAIDLMVEAIVDVCHRTGTDLSDIDLVVPHQANARIVHQVAIELDLPLERVALYIADTGNTSAASIPIALSRAQAEDRLAAGNKVAMAAFGAGPTWGAALLTWRGCLP